DYVSELWPPVRASVLILWSACSGVICQRGWWAMSTTESPRLIYDIERGVSIRPRDAMPENAFNRVDLIDSVDSASPQLNYADVRTRVGLTSMEDVTPAIVEWLWDGHIPLGNITSIDGDPGQGKSLLLLWLAAQVTRGVKGFRQGRVLMLLAEDNADDT